MSVFLILVLVPLLGLALLVVDVSRLQLARHLVAESNELTLQNVLANYDKDLKAIYGLFAAPDLAQKADKQAELMAILVRASRGSLNQTKAKAVVTALVQGQGNMEEVWQSVSLRQSEKSLTNVTGVEIEQLPILTPLAHLAMDRPAVVRKQILDAMKYRGLLSLGQGIYGKLSGLSGVEPLLRSDQARLEVFKPQKVFDNQMAALSRDYQEIVEALKAGPWLKEEQGEKLAKQLEESLAQGRWQAEGKATLAALRRSLGALERAKRALAQGEKEAGKYKAALNKWQSRLEAVSEQDGEWASRQQALKGARSDLEKLTGSQAREQLADLEQRLKQALTLLEKGAEGEVGKEEGEATLEAGPGPGGTLSGRKADSELVLAPGDKEKVLAVLNPLLGLKKAVYQGDFYVELVGKYGGKGQAKAEGRQKKLIKSVLSEKSLEKLPQAIDFQGSMGKEMAGGLGIEEPQMENFIQSGLDGLGKSIDFFAQLPDFKAGLKGFVNDLLLSEYGTEMFSNYLDRKVPGKKGPATKTHLLTGVSLDKVNSPYRGAEVEFLLYGKKSGQANIDASWQRIRWIRFGLNLAYSFTDSELRSYITASSAVAGPLAPVLQGFLHVFLSFAETEMDVYFLGKGQALPLFKSASSWFLKPSQALKGTLTLAKEELLKQAENRLVQVGQGVYDWFEDLGNQATDKLDQVTEDLLHQGQASVQSLVMQALQAPLLEKIRALSNLGLDYVQEAEGQVKVRLDQTLDQVRQSLASLPLEGNKQILLAAFDRERLAIRDFGMSQVSRLAALTLEEKTSQVFEPFNKFLLDRFQGVVDQLSQGLKGQVARYKEEALKVLKGGMDQGQDAIKGGLRNLADKYFPLEGSGEALNKGQLMKGKGLLAFTYPDYLKLFCFLSLLNQQDQGIYARMSWLIGQNLGIQLKDYYIGFSLSTPFKVRQIQWSYLFPALEHQRVLSVSGY